ncbi:hypothetical protein BJ508DRAFT_66928 [Ascobolus immersus RN42]|uniref:Cell surface protein n=1 Tax=Ascobolus immersus RN42 TaxID=1160509 RepID=A0A3N4IPH0_ASCIM|nr:hypothetical protein BJ508DRAFT_66928 [Ascobolus immersus RN42]
MSSNNNFMNTSTHPSTTTDTAGPHNSNVANKLDPRVDSDRDGRAGGLGGSHNTHTAGGFGSQHQPGATSTYGTSTNAGPHDSNMANKLDPRVDSDRDGRATHGTAGGAFGSHNTHSTSTAGPHSSDAANKLDPRVDSDRDGRATHGTTAGGAFGSHNTHGTSTNAGPHNSNVANKLDPRVDSDRDGRATHNTTSGAAFGSHNTHGTSTNAGPHDSNAANKLDPRVDSDRDGRHGAHGTHTGTHGPTTGGALSGSHNNGRATDAGPHDSKLANKLDPRVKTDKDGHAHGTGPTDDTYLSKGKTHNTHNTHNTHGTSTNAGPHDSNAANKLDPRVDSDRDGRKHNAHGGHGGALGTSSNRDHTGTGTLGKIPMVDNHGHSTASHARDTPTSKHNLPGPAPNTAGPHKSDLLNKLDPRVDSNLDGSKTIGGNKTHDV